jgi:protein PhnA
MISAEFGARAASCELCTGLEDLTTWELGASHKQGIDAAVVICKTCSTSISQNDFSNSNHWHCLQGAIWSESIPVKVLSYRILHQLLTATWSTDLLDQILLEEEDLIWAKAGISVQNPDSAKVLQRDSNGTILAEGDSVTLIKDLEVKGAGFTAKRGTLVKNIRLTDHPEHIEGRVNGITIVLVAKFLKKA